MLLYRQLASLVSINTLNDISGDKIEIVYQFKLVSNSHKQEYVYGVDNMSAIQADGKL
jgi:hypothetical protein